MASQSTGPVESESSVPQRARRIPDEKWEIWREELVKLFLEDDVPRKEIVAIMAEKHDFHITEVQLKYRLKKWGVKKYIPDDDLRIMLSVKRKRQRLGKDTRFQYKGHDVEQERMERASKRPRGPLQSPDFVPPYIKMYTSRQHSPQDALNGAPLSYTGRHSIAPQISDIPLLEQYHTRGSPNAAFHNSSEFQFDVNFDFNFGLPPVVQEPDTHSVTHAGESSGDLVMAEALVTAFPQIELTDSWPDVIPSTEMGDEYSGVGTILRDDESPQHFHFTQPSRASSETVPSIDWCEFLNLSPQSPRRSSPGAFLHDNTVGASPERQGSQSKTSEQFNGRLTFLASDHTDPESVMLPLQLLRSNFIESVELVPSVWSIRRNGISQGSTLDRLYSTLQSTWLSLEIEELICRSYELSAQAIRRRQAARPVTSNGTSLPLTLEDDHEYEAPKTGCKPIQERDSDNRPKLKLTSRTWHRTSMGRLNIEFSTPPAESPYVDTSDVPCVVNISFIPRSQQRTIGIAAAFQKYSSISQGCRISPRLRTFNVIPDDSQVIHCILENDLLGVQRLFTEGKASPLDVDSGGFSLLSYATEHRSSDMFRLLLEGGAGTQNCNCYSNTTDVIWAIWRVFAEGGQDRVAFDGNMNKTRLALNHGCDIEDTVSTNSSSANALFNVACWDWSHPTIPIETLEFLLNIGYNIEQQSADGLTPLLSAATQHQPHVVKCLRLFTRRGANPHATDLKGRGVLHCALDASGFFDDLFRTLNGSYLEDSYTPDPQADAFIWFARVSFNTEDNSHKEDYDDEGADPGPLQDNIVNDMFHEADSAANEYSIDYIFCEGFDGALKKIRNPMQVLKERTMFKLLTLLQLGCDPNVVDHEGLSPSDTAREYGLWPQWRWALLNTGYIHHRQHGWVKSSFFK